jgi:hypothetical protein
MKNYQLFLLIRYFCPLIGRNSFTIKEGTWSFSKASRIFYWHDVLKEFIEVDLFHDKRRNVIVYEKHPVNFISTESWWHLLKRSSITIREGTWPFTLGKDRFYDTRSRWHLLKRNSFTIREGTWPFTKHKDRFYWHGVVMVFIEREPFYDKRRNLTIC